MNRIHNALVLLVLAPFSALGTGVAVPQDEPFRIYQTDSRMVIDGRLEEWSDFPLVPVNRRQDGETVAAGPDIGVAAQFSFDLKNFYAAVRVTDDVFEFPNRSWRYGDGLYLTLVDLRDKEESDIFYTFGFSRQNNEIVKIMVNRDGVYFPPISTKSIQAEILAEPAKNSLTYEIAVPFDYLLPFKPLLHLQWGINLIYVDRDRGEREILQLHPDPDYDTERTPLRRGAVFSFVPHAPETAEIQATMNALHFFSDQEKTITLAMNAPPGSSEWTVRYVLSSAQTNISSIEKVRPAPGLNTLTYTLDAEDLKTGVYDLSLGVIDGEGVLRYSQDHTFFVLDREELAGYVADLDEKRKGDLYEKDEVFRSSFPTLEIRFQWIREFMEGAPPFAFINPLNQWYDDVKFLLGELGKNRPALFLRGRIGRLAHRSEIDGTLQPYSVFIPPDYMEQKRFPLLVTLHGSGVDEKLSIYNFAQELMQGRMRGRVPSMIVIAPQGRGLSDWYLGPSGEDVLECVRHVQRLYRIDSDSIILDGFSMGGYGAWRLALLHPEVFSAAIIRSGAVSPPESLSGEHILDLIAAGKSNRFFIIHGDKDNAVPVDNARAAANKLKERSIEHRYIEVKGAAHGGYDRWRDIWGWLGDILGKK